MFRQRSSLEELPHQNLVEVNVPLKREVYVGLVAEFVGSSYGKRLWLPKFSSSKKELEILRYTGAKTNSDSFWISF